MKRYDIGFYIGPCSEEEAVALADAILDLAEAKSVGAGGVGITELADDDPLFAGLEGDPDD